jgi:hypothetical protein
MISREGRRARWVSVFGLLSLWGLARPVWADPSAVSVQVDCPRLSEERRASLESRAKTELLVRREIGTLAVVCSPNAVQLRWHSTAGTASEHSIPLAADAVATEEQILEALEILLNPAEPTAPVAPPAPTSPAATPKPPPRPAATASVPPAPVPRQPLASAPPSAEARLPYFELFAGGGAELWSSEAGAALGPGGRVLWAPSDHLALSGGAAIAWTLQAPEDVSARTVRIQLGGEYHFDRERRWRVGVGNVLDLLHASRNVNGVEETADERVLAGVVRAQYALLARPILIVLGPTFTVRAKPVKVQIGQRELFSLPVVAPGFTAEVGLGPL